MGRRRENNLLLRLIEAQNQEVLRKLDQLLNQGTIIMKELDTLEQQVKANTDAEQSAVVLLNSLSDMLKAAAADPAKVNALADQLKGSSDKLAAAIIANTPAANPPA